MEGYQVSSLEFVGSVGLWYKGLWLNEFNWMVLLLAFCLLWFEEL